MSKVLAKWPKQPGETLDYDISFVDYLAKRNDTVASHAVDVETGLTKEFSTVTDGVVKVWLSGGVDGQTYKVTAKIVTHGGREKHGEVLIKVGEV